MLQANQAFAGACKGTAQIYLGILHSRLTRILQLDATVDNILGFVECLVTEHEQLLDCTDAASVDIGKASRHSAQKP